MPTVIDLTDNTYGKLTVIRRNGYLRGKTAWLCKCECGNEKTIDGNSLKTGNTKSCGCLSKTLNGGSSDRLHVVWMNMMKRCYDSKSAKYYTYGNRGIRVCDEWHDYLTFKGWAMNTGYDPNAPKFQCTIDRIDVNGDYCPQNCKWATAKEQSNNTTKNRRITVNGENMTVSQASEKYGVPKATLWWRVNSGRWDDTEAAITPPRKGKKHYG